MNREKIIVLDFGGQYTQLIAKAIRKCKVFSEIKNYGIQADELKKIKPNGIILSGGPGSVYEEGAPLLDKEVLELGIPVMGICYGMQLLNYILGGSIISGNVMKEYGETDVFIDDSHQLFSGLGKKTTVWMSHGDSVDINKLANGFKVIANTQNHAAAIANNEKKLYGVQFHPEVTHTALGLKIISNFVHKICNCSKTWEMKNYIEECKKYVWGVVGDNDVICFVSGGVDSSFVASVLAQTPGIGNIYPVYINCLMRKNETEEVVRNLEKSGVKNLIVYEAEDQFIKSIEGMNDPEEKRKAIGNMFGKVQQLIIEKLKLNPKTTFLAQGTLYTDLIESGEGVGKKAANIKSHHNVGCEFIEMLKAAGKVVEPTRLIFKDEVREAARELGLPAEISERQPFPGPGLGIRIVNGLNEWVDRRFYQANEKVKEIAKRYNLEGHVLPIKTVGVQGDKRTYSYLALLRGERHWLNIRNAAKRIPAEVHDVNRVVYEISNGQPIAEIITNLIPTTVTRETVNLLKDVDYEGRNIISKYNLKLSQTIFVLFGVDIYGNGKRSVALRAVSTDDFMTASPTEVPWGCLDEINGVFLSKHNVGAFVVDVTDKPPATTCWE